VDGSLKAYRVIGLQFQSTDIISSYGYNKLYKEPRLVCNEIKICDNCKIYYGQFKIESFTRFVLTATAAYTLTHVNSPV